MRTCLGDFPGQVSPLLFVGRAHHRSWCFQRSYTRLCTWERADWVIFWPLPLCPPCIRSALVYSLVHRGWIYTRIYRKLYTLILELTNVKDMFEERRGIVEGGDRSCACELTSFQTHNQIFFCYDLIVKEFREILLFLYVEQGRIFRISFIFIRIS